jgi:hypothetical protein
MQISNSQGIGAVFNRTTWWCEMVLRAMRGKLPWRPHRRRRPGGSGEMKDVVGWPPTTWST